MNPNGVRVGELPGGRALGDLGGGTSMGPTLHISPSACSSGSFVLSFSNKPVTEACFPDSVMPSTKLIDLRRGS